MLNNGRTRIFCTAKIHGAVVSGGNINYMGSITIDKELLKSAGIAPYEMVHVNNITNGNHWETYVIPGETGDIILNGAPARLFLKGDKVVIMRFENIPIADIDNISQTVVYVDKNNKEIK